MSRDPHNLQAFVLADALVVEVYRATKSFPQAERFGLQGQIRRGAVSVAANLIEGCARRSQRDYLQFVGTAIGSASEVRYLIGLAERLGFVDTREAKQLVENYGRVIRALQGLIGALTSPEARGPGPSPLRHRVTSLTSPEARGPRPEAPGPRR